MAKKICLSNLFMFGYRITEPGERFTITNKWKEGNSLYFGADSHVQGGCNFAMHSVVEVNGSRYFLMTETPDISIDDPVTDCMVVKLSSPTQYETISDDELERLTEVCMESAHLPRETRHRDLLQYFGEFPDWVPKGK